VVEKVTVSPVVDVDWIVMEKATSLWRWGDKSGLLFDEFCEGDDGQIHPFSMGDL
jgi:hypothetical protein